METGRFKEDRIAGLMARGIGREQAEWEHRELERELRDFRDPKTKRALHRFFDVFGPPPDLVRRPVLPRHLIVDVFDKADGKCTYCGVTLNYTLNHPYQFTIDHIEPVSRGGDYFKPANLTACCRQCNREKHTLSADEFRGRFS